MPAKALRIFTASVLLVAGGIQASAETAAPSESVTVTATKSREVFSKFVKEFAAPARLTGKIPRWERRICPMVVGQNAHFTAFITQRVRAVALAAGARVDTEASCTPNIEIVFTTTPQDLIDNVRQHQPDYLGYADSIAQVDKLATVTRPIQAWYATETGDLRGMRRLDRGRGPEAGVNVPNFSQSTGLSSDVTGTNFNGDHLALPATHVTASRINDGVVSGFNHIVIVIDTSKMAGQKIVPLSDYISMLALTQINSLDACQQQSSIVNILATDCDHGIEGLTQFDLAYLQGLYKMSAGRFLMFQRNDISSLMADRVTPKVTDAERQ